MEITDKNEIKVIERLRTIQWGSLTITKQNGKIVMVEKSEKEKLEISN